MTATFLFVLNNYNDVDQTAPLMHELLGEGHRVIVTTNGQYNLNSDIRINDLHNSLQFSVVTFNILKILNRNPSILTKGFRTLLFNKYLAMLLLMMWRVDLCLFTWCNPYRKGFQTKLFRAAKQLNVPNICIPHGHNIFTNLAVNQHLKDFFEEKQHWPDFSARNSFDLYVVQTKHHRQRNIDWGMQPNKIVTWGSMRFHPRWIKHHQALCPIYKGFPTEPKSCLKIVFFIPHWHYNVEKQLTIELLVALSRNSNILLAVKGHTRGDIIDHASYRELTNLENVDLNADAPSTALISWSDVVINFGSSIGHEALIVGKPVINPLFLHDNRTVYDNSGAVLDAKCTRDFTRLIDLALVGDLPKSKTVAINKFLSTEVFGGDNELDTTAAYAKSLITFSTSRNRDQSEQLP